jgi:hypothetical protein
MRRYGVNNKMTKKIIKQEDMDLLVEAGLEPKDIGKCVSDIARRYFFDQELI